MIFLTGAQVGPNKLTRRSAPEYLTPLLIGLFGQAIVSLTALTPPVLAVVAAPDLGIRTTDFGLFSSILFLSGMISASMGGTLVKRFGGLRVSQLCLLSSAFGIALAATSIVPLAALGALFVGLGYGPMTPAGSHLLVSVTSKRHLPLVLSIKQTSIPLGGVLAGLMVPAVIEVSNWETAVLTVAGLGFFFALLLQPFRKHYDTDRDENSVLEFHLFRILHKGLQHTGLRRLCLATIGYSSTQICFNAFFIIYLVERASLSLIQAGMIFTMAQLASVGGRIIWGIIAERWVSTRQLLIVLGLIMAAASLTTIWVDSNWSMAALTILGVCFGAAASGWNGLYLAEIVHVTSASQAATATGVSLFFTFGGMMIAPAIFNAIVYLSDSFTTAFVVLTIGLVPSIFLMARKA